MTHELTDDALELALVIEQDGCCAHRKEAVQIIRRLAHLAQRGASELHCICGADWECGPHGWELVAASPQAQPMPDGDPAPPNNLPQWDECALRVSNSKFIAQRVAEGGYEAEPDSMLATELHRFIYEYDDADPYRSAWFLHRLELVLTEARTAGVEVRYVRKPEADKRISRGDDFAGDAWLDTHTGETVYTVVGFDRNQQPTMVVQDGRAVSTGVLASCPNCAGWKLLAESALAAAESGERIEAIRAKYGLGTPGVRGFDGSQP